MAGSKQWLQLMACRVLVARPSLPVCLAEAINPLQQQEQQQLSHSHAFPSQRYSTSEINK